MAKRIPARLTAAEGRKFGFTVGAAFLVLAAVIRLWHGATIIPAVFGTAGALLALGALLVPTHLGGIERAWMRLAHLISKVTTPILMAVIYFIVISPVGLFRRSLGHNALVRKAGGPGLAPDSYWIERPEGKRRGNLSRQF